MDKVVEAAIKQGITIPDTADGIANNLLQFAGAFCEGKITIGAVKTEVAALCNPSAPPHQHVPNLMVTPSNAKEVADKIMTVAVMVSSSGSIKMEDVKAAFVKRCQSQSDQPQSGQPTMRLPGRHRR